MKQNCTRYSFQFSSFISGIIFFSLSNLIFLSSFISLSLSTGDLHQTEVWSDEESLWAQCVVWLRDCPHYFQSLKQALPVCQHWHGQSAPQIHRVQWAARKQDQCRHHRGNTDIQAHQESSLFQVAGNCFVCFLVSFILFCLLLLFFPSFLSLVNCVNLVAVVQSIALFGQG